jgi:hypothetical protein
VTLLIQARGGGGDTAFITLFGGGINDDDTDDNLEPATTCGSSRTPAIAATVKWVPRFSR